MDIVQENTTTLPKSKQSATLNDRQRRFSLLSVTLCFVVALAITGSNAPAQVLDRPQTPPPRSGPKSGTLQEAKRKRPPREKVILRGDELHGRPDVDWAIKLNLAGFTDQTSYAQRPWIVRFAVREDSAGLTLAHIHQRQLRIEDSSVTVKEFVNSVFEKLGQDSTVDVTTMKQGSANGLETVEYSKREIWPEVDPDDSTKTVNKVVWRRHYKGYTLHKGMYVNVHLSKTEYQPKDSAVFKDIIKTFEIVDPAPTVDPRTGKRVLKGVGK